LANAFSSFFKTQTMHLKSIVYNSIAMIIPAGFDPGPSDTEADEMSTDPYRQGIT
jgi:hypothetical protein